jgi:hypothetical protein
MVMLAAGGCNESLPVREDQTRLFTARVSSAFHRENAQNYIRIFVSIVNRTDEVIEERESISGTVQIEWVPAADVGVPMAERKRTLTLSRGNIFRAPQGYDQNSGKLMIRPNDSIVFFANWNLRSNDSTYLPKFWASFTDGQCGVIYENNEAGRRIITKRQRFLVSASVKLFEKLAVLYTTETNLSSCYVGAYKFETNPPQSPCVNINVFDPCSIVGE